MLRGLLVAAGVASCAAATVPAASVKWQGRTLPQPDGSVWHSWEGVQAEFTVTGATTVSMTAFTTFAGGPELHVLLDGAYLPAANLSLSGEQPHNLTLLTGLDASMPHNVTVYQITDPISMTWDLMPPNYHSYVSFTTDGAFGPVPPAKARRLVIIGDSITAGNQIDKATCRPDHWGTYGHKLCAAFDADCQTLAISGKGLYENCCDANATMTQLSLRTLAGFPEPLYDVSSWRPDAVFVSLGTNDANSGNPWRNNATWVQGFVGTYSAFLFNITQTYGGGNLAFPIFAGVGPIDHIYEPWVLAALSTARASYGLSGLHFVNYTTVLDGCGHPGWEGHQQMFDIAQPLVAAALGW